MSCFVFHKCNTEASMFIDSAFRLQQQRINEIVSCLLNRGALTSIVMNNRSLILSSIQIFMNHFGVFCVRLFSEFNSPSEICFWSRFFVSSDFFRGSVRSQLADRQLSHGVRCRQLLSLLRFDFRALQSIAKRADTSILSKSVYRP